MARSCCVLAMAVWTAGVMGCAGQDWPGFISRISGQVFEGQTGRVIVGMTVIAASREVQEGALHLTPAGREGRTDAKGRYEITGLAPGEYLVAAGGNPALQIRAEGARRTAESQMRGMYYPDARDPYLAKTVVVWGGADVVGIDFRMTPEDAFSLRGYVQGVRAVDPVTMFLGSEPRWRDDLFFGRLRPMRPGPFEIGPLLRGTYWLYAYSGERSDPGFRAGCQRVDIRGLDPGPVGVMLAPAFPVTIRLRAGGDAGLPSGGADALPQVELSPLIAQPVASISPTLRVTVPRSGRAVVENVTAEPYQISVSGLPRDWAVRRISYNGALLPDPIVESPRGSMHALDIVVGPVNNSLVIRALEFNVAAGGALVVVAPEWLLARQMGYAELRWIMPANGIVERYGIASGTYRAVALPPGSTWGLAMHLLYGGAGQKIKVEDGSAQSVSLELRR